MSTSGRSFAEAFSPSGIQVGWEAFKRFFPVLYVGGCLKSCTEGGGGGGGGGGGEESETRSGMLDLFGGHHTAWLGPQVQSNDPWEQLQFALQQLAEMAEPLGLVTVFVFGLSLVGIALAFRAWLIPGWLKVHREILVEGGRRTGNTNGPPALHSLRLHPLARRPQARPGRRSTPSGPQDRA